MEALKAVFAAESGEESNEAAEEDAPKRILRSCTK